MNPTTLDDAMANLAAGALEDGEHPSPDELLAYQAGKLAGTARARLQDHLAWCSECARTVVDLASWPDVELRDPNLERTAAEEADDWQAIRQRLGVSPSVDADSDDADSVNADSDDAHDDPVPAPVPVPIGLPRPAVDPPSPVPRRSYGPVHLLAAALALAVVGLSVQVTRLSRQAGAIETPRANVFVVDLEPAGDAATRNRPAGPRGTNVPAGMETVVFLLVQDDLRPFDDHAVELRGDDGEVFWQTAGLVSPPEGGFSVAVPLEALPSDDVDIRLYGVAAGERELLATYRTRIERPDVD